MRSVVDFGTSPHDPVPPVVVGASASRADLTYGARQTSVATQSQPASTELARTSRHKRNTSASYTQTQAVTHATYRVWHMHFLCDDCPNEWTEDGLVCGPAFCPACDRECQPYASIDLLEPEEEPMTNLEHEAEQARMQVMVAEMRALELLEALRNAVAGASHWRLEATNLLVKVDYAIPPDRVAEQLREQLAKHRNQEAA